MLSSALPVWKTKTWANLPNIENKFNFISIRRDDFIQGEVTWSYHYLEG